MEDTPLLTVVRGDPTPEELAALLAVVVLCAARAAEEEDRADVASVADPASTGGPAGWADRARTMRRPSGPDLRPRPGAWRAGSLPG